jgi:chorismate lyase
LKAIASHKHGHFSRILPRSNARVSRERKRGDSRDPSWQILNTFECRRLPEGQLANLLDSGSLTQRLLRASDGDFAVKRIVEAWRRPNFSERQRLGLADREYAFLREVALVCKGEIWVLARSIIPKRSLVGKNKHLSSLGDRPLGATLFKDPTLSRTLFEVCQLQAKQLPDFSWGTGKAANNYFWGRRSVFVLRGQDLLVSEIFLPECPVL